MNATARNAVTRLRQAIRRAAQICRAARYAALNGPLQQQLAEGRLIQASTYLRTLGLNDGGVRSFRSHYGKKVKAAYRAGHSNLDPAKAWVMIDGRWTNVHVYNPSDPALASGVAAYPRLAEVVRFRALEAA